MIYYICSPVYHQTILEAIELAHEVVMANTVSNEVNILKIMKQQISALSTADKLLIDLNCLVDLDEEILQALEMYRMMYGDNRIIIISSTRREGDSLLSRCFQMGIYDLIVTADYNTIKNELIDSIKTGKSFKDTVRFKEQKEKDNHLVIRQEIKQTVYKVLIGVIGTQKHIGTTTNAIVMANFLRGKGFRTAVCEMCGDNKKISDFNLIRKGYEEQIYEDGSFNLYGVDYYMAENQKESKLALQKASEKSYNFIVLDFGEYGQSDLIQFNKCELKFLVTGSKDYEIPKLNQIFADVSEAALKEYHYLFNLTDEKSQKQIKELMEEFKNNVHFPKISLLPFGENDFCDGAAIFEQYLPVIKIEEKKKGILGKLKKRS